VVTIKEQVYVGILGAAIIIMAIAIPLYTFVEQARQYQASCDEEIGAGNWSYESVSCGHFSLGACHKCVRTGAQNAS